MAIVQISRIQHRRGLQQDLPSLASAELGWSIDERRLYIGNGTLEEGAPLEGVTEIVTAPSLTEIGTNLLRYTFKGTDAGYTSQTGATAGAYVSRTLQSVLDESISVKHFGAVGDGTIDDTSAIQRAINQIYVSSLNSIYNPVRRTIRFPAGTYLITSNIVIPPNCQLIGDGKNNTVITSNVAVMQSCDSLFQISTDLGDNDATLPGNIKITDMTLSSSSTLYPVALLEKATDVIFDRVQFVGGTYGLTLTGNTANVEVSSSSFHGSTTGEINISGGEVGLVSRSNYYDTIKVAMNSGSTSIATVANGAGRIDYEISSGTSYRIGSMNYSRGGGSTSFDDEYSEPSTSLGANLYITPTGVVTCIVGATSTMKYNIKQFI